MRMRHRDHRRRCPRHHNRGRRNHHRMLRRVTVPYRRFFFLFLG